MSDAYSSPMLPRPEAALNVEDGRGRDLTFRVDDPSPTMVARMLDTFVQLVTGDPLGCRDEVAR